MTTITRTPPLKQLVIALLLAATLAGCGGGGRSSVDNGGDVGGGNGNGNGDGGNSGGGNGGGGNDGGDVGDGGNSGGGDGGDGGDGGGNGDGGDEPTATIGGNVTGLKGTVRLRINDGNAIELAADGAFSFDTDLTSGSAYALTISTQPSFPAQDCQVANGSGTIDGNVTNVLVTCADLAAATLQADAGPRHATLTWKAPADSTQFNVYLSSVRDCDTANYSTCPDGALLANVSSPLKVRQLRNGQPYFFRVETLHANGARGLSNEAGVRPDTLTTIGSTHAMARAADGTVYLGGSISALGFPAGAAAPLHRQTGRVAQPDFAVVSEHGFGLVYSAASDGAGGWYIGGLFESVGGVPRNNLAHILADGTVDPGFDPDPGTNELVTAIAVFAGKVYVGGYFTEIAGEERNGLAAFDAHDGHLLDWNLDLAGAVNAFAVYEDTLYIGGSFDAIGGELYGDLAAIDADGKLLPWRPVTDGDVFVLAASEDRIYAAGLFTEVNTNPFNNIVAIGRQNGRTIDSWRPEFNEWVSGMAVSGDTLYCGGFFTQVNGESQRYLAAIDATGKATGWKPTLLSEVYSLALSGDTVYVGSSPGVTALSTHTGEPLPSWKSNLANGTVYALALDADTLYAGGWEGMVVGGSRSNLAAIDSEGALLPWNPPVKGTVIALALDAEVLYVGGDFTSVGDATRLRLAAFDAAGQLTAWQPQANARVSALAVADGTVYAGGSFSQVAGVGAGTLPRRRLAAFDLQGQLQDWDPNVVDGNVLALAAADGIVYAGGNFDGIGKAPNVVPVRHFAALDATSGDHRVGWEHRFNEQVRALHIHKGVVYIGGEFTGRDGLPGSASYLDGFMIATGVPLVWGLHVNNVVSAFDSFDHFLYFAGAFTSVGPQQGRDGLAALKNADGSIVLTKWSAPGISKVNALAAGPELVYAKGFVVTGTGALDSGVTVVEAAPGSSAPAHLH